MKKNQVVISMILLTRFSESIFNTSRYTGLIYFNVLLKDCIYIKYDGENSNMVDPRF